jgi:signal recognition particle subunit SEC65
MSRLAKKSRKLTPEELFLQREARERVLNEAMKNKEQEEKITAMMDLIRQEEKENVKEEVVLEVLEEKKDVIAELEAKAKQLEEEEMERQKQILLKQRNATAGLEGFTPQERDGHRIVLLSDRSLKKKEGRELEKHFSVSKFDPKAKVALKDLKYELMIVPVNKKEGRAFYASSVPYIQKDENVSVIYLAKKGKKIQDIDLIKKQYHCQYVRKSLPKDQPNKYLYTLSLFTDHISKLTNSCLPILKVFLDSH